MTLSKQPPAYKKATEQNFLLLKLTEIDPLKFRVAVAELCWVHHHFTPSIICCVHCIYDCYLSSLQSLSLFIADVKHSNWPWPTWSIHQPSPCTLSPIPLIFPICPSQFTEHWMRSDPGSTMFLSLPGTGNPNKLRSPGCWSGVITRTHTCGCADGRV